MSGNWTANVLPGISLAAGSAGRALPVTIAQTNAAATGRSNQMFAAMKYRVINVNVC
jgi:hypothetical protein